MNNLQARCFEKAHQDKQGFLLFGCGR